MNYEYHCDTKIIMGPGKSKDLPEIISEYINIGETVMVVTDSGIKDAGLVDPIEMNLKNSGYKVISYNEISPNPRDTECLKGASLYQSTNASAVIAVGGGSPMDTAKAIALLGPNGGSPEEYNNGERNYANISPVICVPTTAGTGSEVTRSSVITLEESHTKITLKSPLLRPTIAVLDPELTLSVPKSITAATGVDALVHAIEGYTCTVTNPISQAMGKSAMSIIVDYLPKVYQDGKNLDARYKMQEGSLLAGLCFGSADVASVHCLSEALSSLYDTPHGVANAIFLPHVVKFNAVENKPLHAEISKIMQFAKQNDTDEIAIEKLIKGLYTLTNDLGIPSLKELGYVKTEHFEQMANLAKQNNSTPSNVRPITEKDYLVILKEAY